MRQTIEPNEGMATQTSGFPDAKTRSESDAGGGSIDDVMTFDLDHSGRSRTSPPNDCWVLTSREPPFKIKCASESWTQLWGFSCEDAIGTPVSILNGPGSNAAAAAGLMQRFKAHGSIATARCTNATKGGRLHTHSLTLMDHPSGLLGISTDILHDAPSSPEIDRHNAELVPAGAPTVSKVLCEVALQVGTGLSTPRESAATPPVAEEPPPAASAEECCVALHAPAGKDELATLLVPGSRQAFEDHQRLSLPGLLLRPPPISRAKRRSCCSDDEAVSSRSAAAEPVDAEKISAELAQELLMVALMVVATPKTLTEMMQKPKAPRGMSPCLEAQLVEAPSLADGPETLLL